MLAGLPPESQLGCLLCRAVVLEPVAESARSLVRAGVDWERFLGFAAEQGIFGLLDYHASHTLPDLFPSDIRKRLRATAAVNGRMADELANELVAVLDLLESAGIVAVPFKGPVLIRQIWGDYRLGVYLDLDLLVKPGEARRAAEVLSRRGYISAQARVGVLPAWSQGRDRLELVSPCGRSGYPLRLDLHTRAVPDWIGHPDRADRFWERLQRGEFRGAAIWRLPDDWNLTLVALHALGHLFESLRWVAGFHGLAQVCEGTWPAAQQRAEEIGAGHEVLLARRVCERILDVECAEPTGTDPLVARLAEGPFRPEHNLLERHRLQLALRRTATAKIAYVLSGVFEPRPTDVRVLPLPPLLSPLYFVLRPIRLMAKYFIGSPLKAARRFFRRPSHLA
jgi:hypothetical protein